MDNSEVTRIGSTEKVAGTDGTWSQCTRRGNMLFISGQIALDAAGELVGADDFEAQAIKALDNLKSMLEAGGAS